MSMLVCDEIGNSTNTGKSVFKRLVANTVDFY